MVFAMPDVQRLEARLDEAFDRIEGTILPCVTMVLESLLEASEEASEVEPKALAAELQTLAAELDQLIKAVEQDCPRDQWLTDDRAASA